MAEPKPLAAKLEILLRELHAVVWGECPSLLNEDSGGDAALDLAIREVLARAATESVALQSQLAARDQQIARLREAVEAVQWGDERYCDDLDRPESGVLYMHCPDCGNPEDDGHAEGCIVRIALADTPAVEPDPRDQQIARLRQELSHLVRLLEPLEREGRIEVPGLATLNGARAALAEVPEPTGATLAADRVTTGTIIATTDTERLNKLEALARSGSVGNGIALFPITYIHDGSPSLQLQELGDEDGTDLGDVVAQGRTLREAIDALSEPTKEGE